MLKGAVEMPICLGVEDFFWGGENFALGTALIALGGDNVVAIMLF